MRGLIRQVALTLSVGIMLITNFGFGQNDFSDTTVEATIYNTYRTAVTPASYTFAVWLPIFLGCIAFVIYQALPSRRHDARLDRLGWPMAAAFLLNALTPFTPLGASNIVIVLLLLTLLLAYQTVVCQKPQDTAFFWLVRVPIAIFLAWITVATIVNTAQFLVSFVWNGFGIPDALWSALLIAVATAIGLLVVWTQREVSFALVLVWAFVGVAIANGGLFPVVLLTVLGGVALLGLTGWKLWAGRVQRLPISSS